MASRNVQDCVDELQQKIPLIVTDYNKQFSGRSLRPIATLRSTAEQQQDYAVGRTKPPIGDRFIITKLDGITKLSKHNPDPLAPKAKAVDFGVFIGGKYVTDNIFYYPLLDLARKYDLISGGDFMQTGHTLQQLLQEKAWRDWPHIETKAPLYILQVGT